MTLNQRVIVLLSGLAVCLSLLLTTFLRQDLSSTEARAATAEGLNTQLRAQQSSILAVQDNADSLRATAEAQSKIAHARELAAYSTSSLDSNPDLGLLLGIEAVNTTYKAEGYITKQAYAALQQALSSRLLATLRHSDTRISNVIFNKDGTRILGANLAGELLLWDEKGNYLTNFKSNTEAIQSYKFSPDGSKILAIGCDQVNGTCGTLNTAYLWDSSGNLLLTLVNKETLPIVADFSSDSKWLVIVRRNGELRAINTEGQGLPILQLPEGTLPILSMDPDSDYFWVSMGNNQTSVYRLDDGMFLTTVIGDLPSPDTIEPDPTGKRLITRSKDNTLRLWDETGKLIRVIRTDAPPHTWISFSPTGNQFLIIEHAGVIQDYKAENGSLATQLDSTYAFNGWISSVEFATSQCNDYATEECFGSRVTTTQVWDQNGQLIKTYGNIAKIIVSPDGTRYAVVTSNGQAQLRDSQDNILAVLGNTDNSPFRFIVFSPDSKIIAWGGCDDENIPLNDCRHGSTRLWDTTTGKLRANLISDTFPEAPIFSPDGIKLISKDGRGFSRLWSINPNGVPQDIDSMLAEASRRLARTLTDEECKQYLDVDRCPTNP